MRFLIKDERNKQGVTLAVGDFISDGDYEAMGSDCHWQSNLRCNEVAPRYVFVQGSLPISLTTLACKTKTETKHQKEYDRYIFGRKAESWAAVAWNAQETSWAPRIRLLRLRPSFSVSTRRRTALLNAFEVILECVDWGAAGMPGRIASFADGGCDAARRVHGKDLSRRPFHR